MTPTASYLDILIDSSGSGVHDHLYGSLVRNGLKKILLSGGFFSSCEEKDPGFLFPAVKMTESKGDSNLDEKSFSIILVCRHYIGVERFFYEMISRWLLPGQKLGFTSFSYCNFFFSFKPLEKFSFCEVRFFCEGFQDCSQVSKYFLQIESEIKLGSLSLYQGNRILNFKGQFSSEKNSLIHERVAGLIQRRPLDFDYDIFGQMQHFFVNCREEFKQIREPQHLSRIIYVFYLFRKALKERSEVLSKKRHVSFKLSQVRLYSPFGIRKVTGVFLGLNFLKRHEIFEERHLIKALKDRFPSVKIVEGSQFMYLQKEEKIHLLYLEIEKEDGSNFSLDEILFLRKKFPQSLENQIEKLMPSVFMPRNEEEVMKNILILSSQLKYVKDLPQVVISFEEQTDFDLTFTVILLRILPSRDRFLMRELFNKGSSRFIFMEDRVKNMGLIRGRYLKEASVFRLKTTKSSYLRKDHSVDLLMARQDVVKEIQRMVGEFRDYNGGMIANQVANLYSFKKLFPYSEGSDDLELENFFHAIFPVEMRSVIEPYLLKILYDIWRVALEDNQKGKQSLVVRREKESVVLFACFIDLESRKLFMDFIKDLNFTSSQALIFSSEENGKFYLGYILLGLSRVFTEDFIDKLKGFSENGVAFKCF